MFHKFISADEGVQCYRCGGYWSDERENEAGMCVADDTEFGTVHGSDYENQGHDLDCTEFAEHGTCKHVEHDCNCDICEYN